MINHSAEGNFPTEADSGQETKRLYAQRTDSQHRAGINRLNIKLLPRTKAVFRKTNSTKQKPGGKERRKTKPTRKRLHFPCKTLLVIQRSTGAISTEYCTAFATYNLTPHPIHHSYFLLNDSISDYPRLIIFPLFIILLILGL